MMASSVQAAISFPTAATKTSTQISSTENRYEVTLSVPGSESTKYNEIIVMVDASSSQGQNFAELKSTLRAVGQKILGENGNTKLTLMGFGVAPKLAFSVNSLAELENVLSTVSQSDLYYGRSATNCESAFTFIQSYINNSNFPHQ